MVEWNWLDINEKRHTFMADIHKSWGIRLLVAAFATLIGAFVIGVPLSAIFYNGEFWPGAPIGMLVGFLGIWMLGAYGPRLHELYGVDIVQRDCIRKYDNYPASVQREIGDRKVLLKTVKGSTHNQARMIRQKMDEVYTAVLDKEREIKKTLPPELPVEPSPEERKAQELIGDLGDKAKAIHEVAKEMRQINS